MLVIHSSYDAVLEGSCLCRQQSSSLGSRLERSASPMSVLYVQPSDIKTPHKWTHFFCLGSLWFSGKAPDLLLSGWAECFLTVIQGAVELHLISMLQNINVRAASLMCCAVEVSHSRPPWPAAPEPQLPLKALTHVLTDRKRYRNTRHVFTECSGNISTTVLIMLHNPSKTQPWVWVHHFQILRNLLLSVVKLAEKGIRTSFYFGNVVYFCKAGCSRRKTFGGT